MELLAKVKAKKAEIKSLGKPNWETNLSFGYNPESASDRVNLQVVTSFRKLTDIYCFLLDHEARWNDAVSELGLQLEPTVQESMWQNFSIAAWKKDIKTRIAVLLLETKKAELKALEDKVDKLISPEQRRQLELDALEKEVG
jgi:hypothetical protein